MNTKHAPGPWKRRAPKPAQFPEYEIVDTSGRYVASVKIRAHNNPIADGDLIVAAPELLAAVKALVNFAAAEIGLPVEECIAGPIGGARAAIAKAEGGQT